MTSPACAPTPRRSWRPPSPPLPSTPARQSSTCLLGVFFFQAEDGIRDKLVTGVQTCALPISADTGPVPDRWAALRGPRRVAGRLRATAPAALGRAPVRQRPPGAQHVRGGGRRYRSEERRVGKECRSRWSAYQ